MKILFVMDKLEKLDQPWDTSLSLARVFLKQGHTCYAADLDDLKITSNRVTANAGILFPTSKKTAPNGFSIMKSGQPSKKFLRDFQLVLIRKDPPVNESYFRMTYLLESEIKSVAMANHPAGIRGTNEKTGILNFPEWIPKTIVTNSTNAILQFQRKINSVIVIKPLNNKGGEGIFLIKKSKKNAASLLAKATSNGAEPVMAQEFLPNSAIEKRLIVIHGKIFAGFEKRSPRHDFRANLGLAGTFHPCRITAKENSLVRNMRPYLLKNGLNFVGLDVKGGKLIDFNVTSPAGITECDLMYSRVAASKVWARSLASLVRNWHSK